MSAALVQPEAEMAVCGSVLRHGRRALAQAREILDDDAMANALARDTWAAIRACEEAGKEINPFTVGAELGPRRQSDWIRQAMHAALSHPSELRSVCQVVRDAATARRAIEVAERLVAKVRSGGARGLGLAGELKTTGELLSQLANEGTVAQMPWSAREVLDMARDHREMLVRGEIPSITTGLEDFDRYYKPRPGHVVVIGGRPKMGKTATALQLCLNAMFEPDDHGPLPYRLREDPVPVLYVCDEMTAVELITRMLSNLAGISAFRFTRPELEWLSRHDDRIRQAEDLLASSPLHIERDDRTKQLAWVYATAAVWRSKHEIIGRDKQGRPVRRPAILALDYLQQFAALPGTKSGASKREIIDAQLDLIKDKAKRLGLATYLLSQLNRKLEDREWESGERRPRSSDHKESGAIEQYADAIIGVYRDVRYDPAHDDYKEQLQNLKLRMVDRCREHNLPIGQAMRGLTWICKMHEDDPEREGLIADSPLGRTEIDEYVKAWRKLTEIELIISDNRHGETGIVRARFEGSMYRVEG